MSKPRGWQGSDNPATVKRTLDGRIGICEDQEYSEEDLQNRDNPHPL